MIAKHKSLHPLELKLSLTTGLSGGSSNYAFANADAAAYVARMTTQPDNSYKAAIDTFIGALITAGIWAITDCLQIYSLHSSQASTLNAKSTSFTATVTNGTFYAGAGFWLDGTDDYISTGFAPASGTNFVQDSACIAIAVRNADQRSAAVLSAASATIPSLISPRNATDKVVTRVNTTTNTTSTASNTSGFGVVAGNRTASNVELQYVRGALHHTGSSTSAARSATAITLGRSNTSYIEQQPLMFLASASLDATQQAALSTAWDAFATTLGIYPAGFSAAAGQNITVPLIAHKVLPDGANAELAGRGLPGTGWDANAAGTQRWLGWSLATNNAAGGIVRVSSPAADAGVTLVGEYPLADLGASASITVPAQSATQGIYCDKDDGTIWWVAKDIAGATTYLAHAAAPVGTDAPVLLSCKAFSTANINGIAKDKRGQWWCLDTSAARLYQMTVAGDGTPTLGATFYGLSGGNYDQLGYDVAKDVIFVSGGPNGSNGYIQSIPLAGSYGLPYVRQRFTMTDWLGTEGVYLNGNQFEGPNDQYTHVEASFPYNNLSISGPVTVASS